MPSSRADAWARRVVAWTAVLAMASGARPALGQPAGPPAAVPQLDLATLAGEWVEVASTGSWALRRCVSDTRHQVRMRGSRSLRLTTRCATREGALTRHGVVSRSGPAADGRLHLRYAPRVLTWAPGARSDFVVLAAPPGGGWLLAGDRARQWMVVWSRTIALDESAYAAALAAARRQGFDVSRLARVPQPSGVSGPPAP